MYLMWVNHHLPPDEFYAKSFGAQRLLCAFTEMEAEDRDKLQRQINQQRARR